MDLDFADVKPTVLSFATVTVMAVVGIVILKWLTTRWPIPGISQVVQAV